MEVFEIKGGKRLSGEISVSGLKNAATPIIAATLLTKETCVLHNVPRIEDVFRMLEILQSMGAQATWQDDHTLTLSAKNVDPGKADQEVVKRLRSSILLMGPLAARFSKFYLRQPGGCVIGARPVDTHISALKKMGLLFIEDENGYHVDTAKRRAAKVVLREFSVTATENIMMLAATLPGTTEIKIAAAEPHVEDLGRFLIKMGATIEGLGTHTLRISGRPHLRGVEHEVISDHNEAATFLVLGVATGSPITVVNAQEEHLDIVLEKLREFGADFSIEKNKITVIPAKKLRAVSKVETAPYPGIPTETQALFGMLATQAEGETLIFEKLFEGRFNYISELVKMGAQAQILNPHQVVIQGPTPLRGTVIKSYDLRAGATLVIAALVAEGKAVIEDIYQVDRGYERLEERLQNIGADIRRAERE